ncbi:MAG TPA: hypothetical protein VH985_12070 [Candidatus Binatia bacterium]|jgi:hypothetical protein
MTMTEDIAGFAAAFNLSTAPAELLPRVGEAFLDSWERLAEKYRACARQGEIQEPAISRSLEMLSRIEDIDDVRNLMRLFATGDSPVIASNSTG